MWYAAVKNNNQLHKANITGFDGWPSYHRNFSVCVVAAW